MPDQDLLRAEARATAARGKLDADLAILKDRLMPKRIAERVTTRVSDKSEEIARVGRKVVHERPALAVGAVVAATALLFRRSIGRAFSARTDETPASPTRSQNRRFRKAKS